MPWSPRARASVSNQPYIPADRLAELHLLESALAGQSILDYMPRISPVMPGGVPALPPQHLKPIADLIALSEYQPVRVCVSVPPRHGKQLADSTPVFTPQGWKQHGDLRTGDEVYAVDGSITRVVGRHGGLVCDMEVVTSDGDVIVAHADHLWTVVDRSGKPTERVVDTKTMLAEGLQVGKPGRGQRRARFLLPNRGVLEGRKQPLPFEPYFLGVWLGDGSTSASKINMSAADAVEVMGLLEDRGHKFGAWWRHPVTGVISWMVLGTGVAGYFSTTRKAGRKWGTRRKRAGRKYIPEVYFTAPVEARRELLRGLVDTDGSIDETGRVHVCGVDEHLIEQVATLARTLGYRAAVYKADPHVKSGAAIQGRRPVYTASWTPHDGERQAYLPRKHARTKPAFVKRMASIVEIRPALKPEVGHCIAVDHPSHTYLAGKYLTPTHNTELILHAIAWYLQRHPEHTVAYVSYSGDVAGGKSVHARDIALASGVQLRGDQWRANEWRTVQGGGVLATGIGGALTSFGANLVIVDDPIKNREEAESPTQRQSVWDWFTSTAMTRVTPKGSVIVVHTRWHPDDLIGRLAKKGGWTVINLPAEDTTTGQWLWPEGGWTKEVLSARRTEIGEYDWWALFQGEPRPRGGRLFEEPEYYDKPVLLGSRIFIACDPAATAGTHSDYSVIIVGACWLGPDKLPRIDILDVHRVQVEIPRLVQTLLWYQGQWRAPIGVEAVAGFKAVPQTLRQQAKGVRILDIPAVKDKFTRALPVSAAWNGSTAMPGSKRIRLPRNAAWLGPFLDEIHSFTGIADDRDDQVDALAHLYWMAHNLLSPRKNHTASEMSRYLPFG